MPAPPENAPPAEAPAVGGTDDRPPHPETPRSLEEQQPSAELLAKTSYQWLPGHWIWTRRAVRLEERRVDLQGQRHDLGAAALGLGRQAMGVLRRRLGEAGHEERRLQPTSAPGGPDVAAKVNRLRPSTTEAARSASVDDHRVRMDGRVRGATHPLSGLAPVLPLPLVSPTRVLPPASGVPQRALSLLPHAPTPIPPSCAQPASESWRKATKHREAAQLSGALRIRVARPPSTRPSTQPSNRARLEHGQQPRKQRQPTRHQWPKQWQQPERQSEQRGPKRRRATRWWRPPLAERGYSRRRTRTPAYGARTTIPIARRSCPYR